MKSSYASKLVWIAAAAGVVLLAAGFWFYRGAVDRADRAAREHREGMELVAQLRLVHGGGDAASGASAALAETAFIPRFESALKEADISISALRSVTPRLDRSGAVSYRMTLMPVQLRPAVEALQNLTGSDGLSGRVTSLTLSPAGANATGQTGAENWRIEAEIIDATGTQP